MHTLIIDTSYGSTVGIQGHQPIVQPDSRTHVEQLQHNIGQAAADAGITPHDIEQIVVGTGPAPFTGLRAGIVAAKAIAYATGAQLLGQNILTPQAALLQEARRHDTTLDTHPELAALEPAGDGTRHLALAVNDARRKQLYFALIDTTGDLGDTNSYPIPMDIDYPESIAQRVNNAVTELEARHPGQRVTVTVVGHGAGKYADAWQGLRNLETVIASSVLDYGAEGLDIFARCAQQDPDAHANPQALEPLYLRRPDVSVPKPLKPVLAAEPDTHAA
ncbi:tRNA (adenosine(37)-N6)-threonylcarbamoyltransferase complex dimerization subunit type 1 TsaB [Bifidobacterium magnum]|uniref:Glycoprotease M22 family n=1 Tax=Bifidobacterium magnum TaxID=1692 RepID=A0A087BA82_9BIFI|nr:tRNA (adenosine(37)-N6)-threonylcarbamoyltransferase complex dimerization subunit type 1 TsaB [Bifidobacterium magnum]KFI67932.1 Glycoprotease M22 family [Bifidobacterium magnum]